MGSWDAGACPVDVANVSHSFVIESVAFEKTVACEEPAIRTTHFGGSTATVTVRFPAASTKIVIVAEAVTAGTIAIRLPTMLADIVIVAEALTASGANR